jgi:hydrogenase expression/formation protein HypC
MCLGIPGQVVELDPDNEQLAKVDVAGVRRMINIGLLEDEDMGVGDWVLIHVGFAMSKIDEAEADRAWQGLQLMGQAYTDEINALRASRIEERATMKAGG